MLHCFKTVLDLRGDAEATAPTGSQHLTHQCRAVHCTETHKPQEKGVIAQRHTNLRDKVSADTVSKNGVFSGHRAEIRQPESTASLSSKMVKRHRKVQLFGLWLAVSAWFLCSLGWLYRSHTLGSEVVTMEHHWAKARQADLPSWKPGKGTSVCVHRTANRDTTEGGFHTALPMALPPYLYGQLQAGRNEPCVCCS